MLELPDQIPLEAASGIIAMGRDGSWRTKQLTFGKYVWNVAGYGLKIGLTDAPDITPIGSSVPPGNLGELCDTLEQIHLEATAPQAVGIAPILVPILIEVVRQAIAFLRDYLGRK